MLTEKEIEANKMLTEKEIGELHPDLNFDVVKEGLKQADEMLRDIDNTSCRHDQKALALFKLYLVASIVLYSIGFFSIEMKASLSLVIPVVVAASLFTIGCILSLLSFKPSDYGTLGRHPDTWLRKNVITGDNAAYCLTMCYVLYQYTDKMSAGYLSNDKKSKYISIAINCGILSMVAFPFLMFYIIYLSG